LILKEGKVLWNPGSVRFQFVYGMDIRGQGIARQRMGIQSDDAAHGPPVPDTDRSGSHVTERPFHADYER
jgi:hypothetical protein